MENAGKYLADKLEPSESNIDECFDLRESFINHEYGSSGNIEIVLGKTIIKFEYAPISRYHNFDNWLRIGKFTLTKDGEERDLLESLPSNFLVVFRVDKQDWNGEYDPTNNKIGLTGNPLSKLGIFTLLHEIGHYDTRQKLPLQYWMSDRARTKLLSGLGIVMADGAHTLRDERYAWSYALRTLRPYLSDLGLSDDEVHRIIHSGLHDYSNSIRNVVDLSANEVAQA